MHESLDLFIEGRRHMKCLDFWQFHLLGLAYWLERMGKHEEAAPLVNMWIELKPIKEFEL